MVLRLLIRKQKSEPYNRKTQNAIRNTQYAKRSMNAINRTRNKFIAVTMLTAMIVLIMIDGVFMLLLVGTMRYSTYSFIDTMMSAEGVIDSSPRIEIGRDSQAIDSRTEYIYVRRYNNESRRPHISSNMGGKYTADEMIELSRLIDYEGKVEGKYGDFLYKVKDTGLTTTVCAVNISADIQNFKKTGFLFLLVIGTAMVFISVVTIYFSRWAMRPLETAWTKQKQFISDASHELKTPLSVIISSAQMLKYDLGPENKWLANIENQSDLMNELIKDLLELAKLDETQDTLVMEEFDLSSLVENASLEFEATAFETHREYTQSIEPDIVYKGNESMIRHLVTILIDNALKHSEEGGRVSVSLEKIRSITDSIPNADKIPGMRPGKIILQVFNTGGGIKKEDRERIFERFYRSDESRSRKTGGYGLGLSIAKTIVDAHNGQISADGETGEWVAFTVVL